MSEQGGGADFVPIEEAAQLLGVTVERVTQWANAGVLPVQALEGNPHDIGLPALRRVARKALDELAARLGKS